MPVSPFLIFLYTIIDNKSPRLLAGYFIFFESKMAFSVYPKNAILPPR